MDYKVSVIVPVYKAEKYLSQCVESLLAQTLDGVEIILVEDGSPDNCGRICDDYADRNSNIVVLHLDNGGPSRARNKGIEIAQGEYIGFADADDYVEPKMYELLYKEAAQNQTDIVMCKYFIDDGNTVKSVDMEYEKKYESHEEIIKGLSMLYSTCHHNGLYSVCNKLFDNNLLCSNRLRFDESLIRAEDAWFVFECLKVANRVQFIDSAMYYYRQVASSTMHTFQADRYQKSKAFRKKLMEENKQLNIIVDPNKFYQEFLYETIVYCRAMIKYGYEEYVDNVLNDDFFQNACKYLKCLPIHLQLICVLETLHMKFLIKIFLNLWAGKKKAIDMKL